MFEPSTSVGAPQSGVGTNSVGNTGVSVAEDSSWPFCKNWHPDKMKMTTNPIPIQAASRRLLVLRVEETFCFIIDLPHEIISQPCTGHYGPGILSARRHWPFDKLQCNYLRFPTSWYWTGRKNRWKSLLE